MNDVKEITLTSTFDSSPEKSLFFLPEKKVKIPLVIGLHTWSFDRSNQLDKLLPFCKQRNWALLLPEFRGPNLTTNPRASQACASRLAKQDIIDALDWMVKKHSIDENKVFLIGGSGGGHMALMMAAYAPKKFRAISAWCPITDLTAWHGQNAGYAPEVEACCGGKPLSSPEVDREYRERSPLFHVAGMANANLSVHHGRFDNLVPYSHTVNLALALEKLLPKNFFFAIFDGGHTILYETAFRWFDKMTQNDIRKDKELTR